MPAVEATVYEETELELLQVETGDQVKTKQVLDEAVITAVLEQVPEDYGWDNLKLLLMAAACLFACMAQFAPVPFPDSRPILGVCGAAYFVLSGILQFITTFIDKDCILLTKKVPDSENKEMQKYGLRIRTNFPRFSEFYSVIIEFQKPKEDGPSPQVEQEWSVGKFFDKEGYFDEVGLMQEVEKLVKRFIKKDYTKDPSKESKKTK